MQDPVADMICRINNAQARAFGEVAVPYSKHKQHIAEVLKSEGYIAAVRREGEVADARLIMQLKYFKGKPVIRSIARVSKPSRRVYCDKNTIPRVRGGLGIAVVSTSRGVLSDREARRRGLGGEVVCLVE